MTSQNKVGFTLVEMAVVLVIMSLIVGGGLILAARQQEAERQHVTEERIAFILDAVSIFARAKNYVPCPAGPALALSDNDFGVAKHNGTACSASDLGVAANAVVIGSVPAYALGIAPIYMLDGWNRRFTYVVDQDLANPTGAGFINNASDIDLEQVGGGTRVRQAVLVISHGANGHGAWPGRGGTRLNTGIADSTPEGSNAHITGGWDTVFVQGLPTSNFDDFVAGRTVWQLQRMK